MAPKLVWGVAVACAGVEDAVPEASGEMLPRSVAEELPLSLPLGGPALAVNALPLPLLLPLLCSTATKVPAAALDLAAAPPKKLAPVTCL